MGVVFLIRHAQASFLEPNYDKLSKLGEAQARLLGEYWARHRIVFDRACTGPCVRQKETIALVSRCVSESRASSFPTRWCCGSLTNIREKQSSNAACPDCSKLTKPFAISTPRSSPRPASAERRATFQKLFEAVIGKWVREEICPPGVETWLEFCSRVNSGLTKFLSAGSRGERVAIFTSGGPIAVAMQRALQLSAESTLNVSWMSRNSSWSEFIYSGERFTLSSFNCHAHIDDAAMLTYR